MNYLVIKMSNDIQAIRYMVASEIPSLIQGLLGFVAALVVLGTVSWKVTLLTVSVAPVMVVIASILGKAMGTSLKEWQGDMAVINALAQDATSGIVVTKAYNLQNHLERRFYLAGERAVNRAVKLAFVKGQLNSAMLVLSVMPFLILFGVGGFEVISGKLSLGQLLMMLNLLNNLTWPLQGMAQNFANIKAALQAADRIFEILTFPTERTGGITRFAYEDVEYAVEFDQVSFTYQTQEAVLCDLTLKIRKGEALAIVGASGAGKSTLLSILLGFRAPCSGSLRFFGQPYDSVNLACIREKIAYVPQEAFLLPVSVAENISYGRPNASLQEIREAAIRAGADEFICELPEGYQTLLAEQGINLSGGQRQRMSLARAILRGAPLLVLDEATAALDTESESTVYNNILQFEGTKVIITHRLHLLEKVDRIAVLDKGRVVEDGTHTDLLARQGYYASLYQYAHRAQTEHHIGAVEVC
ncbi:MAG: ABC transporter ATP-binding protein [Peptococcaceae bacterium]|nr:ABC transporter ATP-binding protein [Peptococcaceae bacterium]